MAKWKRYLIVACCAVSAFGDLHLQAQENERDLIYSTGYVRKKLESVQSKDASRLNDQSREIAKKAILDYKNVAGLEKDKETLIDAILIYPQGEYYFNLGNCLYFLKIYAESTKAFDMAARLCYRESYFAYYNAACTASLQKDMQSGLKYLERAISFNYIDFDQFRRDADLRFLRTSPDFEKLIGGYRKVVKETLSSRKWMNDPMVGASDPPNYRLNPDGTYIYSGSFYAGDGSPRVVKHEGTWDYDGGWLILTREKETIGSGVSMGPAGSEFKNLDKVDLRPFKTEKKRISKIECRFPIGSPLFFMMTIDGIEHWNERGELTWLLKQSEGR